MIILIFAAMLSQIMIALSCAKCIARISIHFNMCYRCKPLLHESFGESTRPRKEINKAQFTLLHLLHSNIQSIALCKYHSFTVNDPMPSSATTGKMDIGHAVQKALYGTLADS